MIAIGAVATLLAAGSVWYAYRMTKQRITVKLVDVDEFMAMSEEKQKSFTLSYRESMKNDSYSDKVVFIQKHPAGTRH